MKNTNRSHRHLVIVYLISLLVLTVAGRPDHSVRPMLAAGAPANLSKPEPATQGHVLESYGKLPFAFEANQGQADARAKFLSRGAGYTLFLTGDEAVLELRQGHPRSLVTGPSGKPEAGRKRVTNDQELMTKDSVLRMKLIGANPNAIATGTDELPGKSNYFIGNDPKKWRTNVPTYARVKYAGVYPGVDLVYYGNQGQLEYDFVVAPGADPKAIKLNVGAGLAPPTVAAVGARPRRDGRPAMRTSPLQHRAPQVAPLRIDRNGDLVVKISGGEVRFHKPVVYQPDAVAPVSSPATALRTAPLQNTRHSSLVDGHYRLAGHQVTFSVGSYDRTKPLVIDPALSYSTYLGGSVSDQGLGITVDHLGHAYVTGQTFSTNFPTTPGAFQTGCDHGCTTTSDAFVTKLNATGSALFYSTFIGGSSTDFGQSIAIDGSGDAYVTGTTDSIDFPNTAGAFQNISGGGEDAFVTELNPTGSGLVYSTYLGGSGSDQGFGIMADRSGDAFVTGTTSSTNFPVTSGAFQATFGGISDAFVAELNPSGSALVYSTYLGGSSSESGNAIALDNTGHAYVTGSTLSADFPTTPGAFEQRCIDNCAQSDVFVTRLNPTGSKLAYSTYLGGGGADFGLAIAVSGRNAYVVGSTFSSQFPTTAGAFETTYPGNTRNGAGFVTELNTIGSAQVYSTFLGIGNTRSVAVDSSGNTYVTGITFGNFFTTPGAFETVCNQDGLNCNSVSDAYMTELDPTGSTLVYSTLLGGTNADYGNGIALDPSANVYLTGYTAGSFFPTTPGVFQTTFGGSSDAFVTMFVPSPNVGLSRSSLDFGTFTVGTTSPPLTTTLTNTGNLSLTITGVNVMGPNKGDFTRFNLCGTEVAAGANCKIGVTYTPSVAGSETATLFIADSAPTSPQKVSLSGSGTLAGAMLSPTSLQFPTEVVFTNSPAENVTLTNTGTGPLTISFIGTTGQYSETNNCGSSVAAGASCTISVTFSPTTKGLQNGSVFVDDNAPSGSQQASLQGFGTYVQLVPTSLIFGGEPVGMTSPPKTVTVTNKGSATVNITSIAITGVDPGDFAETSTCGSSLAPGEICTISVTFTPTVQGTRSASVAISDDGGGSPQSVRLLGIGT